MTSRARHLITAHARQACAGGAAGGCGSAGAHWRSCCLPRAATQIGGRGPSKNKIQNATHIEVAMLSSGV